MYAYALMLLFLVLEMVFPFRRMKFFKSGFWMDLLWYTFVQGFLLELFVYKYINEFYSGINLHLISKLPIWGQFLFLLVFIDFLVYWIHRLDHAWFPLWRIHEVHHSTIEMNWLSASRIHFLELIKIRLIGGLIIAALGASEYALYLLGIVDITMGMFLHSNLKVKLGPLKYLFNSPEMHHVHHMNQVKYQFSNYSEKLALWDWLFGTACLPTETTDMEIGIGYHYPQNFVGQFFYLFRKK